MSYFGDGYAKLSFPIANPDAAVAGFREAQRGALFAIGAHFTARTDSAIVTMPTGSGKTAVLQATAFLLRATRTLVITPSRLVREQIAADFATLGVLKRIGALPEEAAPPRVHSTAHRIVSAAGWEALKEVDVVVATVPSVSSHIEDIPKPPPDLFDLILVDEAHHSASADQVPVAGFDLFTELARTLLVSVQNPSDSPWLLWLAFFQRSGGKDFAARKTNTFAILADLLIEARAHSNEAQAVMLYAVARTLFHPAQGQVVGVATALAAMLPIKRLREAVEQAPVKKSERQIVFHEQDFMLWAVLRSWQVRRGDGEQLEIVVDLGRLHHDAMLHFRGGFDRDIDEPEETVTIPVQALYQALSNQKPSVSEREIDAIRPFFNDPKVRERLSPVAVSRRSSAVPLSPSAAKPVRPTLTVGHGVRSARSS